MKGIRFFLHMVKHDLNRLKKELKLREYDNIIDNAEDKEHFIKKDEADIKKSYEILRKNLDKLSKHIK